MNSVCVTIFTENENNGIRLLRGKQGVWFGSVFITSVQCLNSTKYKYQEGQTKRESKTEQKGRCNWKERKTEKECGLGSFMNHY